MDISGLPLRRENSHYTFSITGLVTDDRGEPLQGADVILTLDKPVYEAITTVKSAIITTSVSGGFVFMYITDHRKGVKYALKVRKEGFEPETVSGSAPPAVHHSIRLKKTMVSDGDKR